jgi:hypothetical protein
VADPERAEETFAPLNKQKKKREREREREREIAKERERVFHPSIKHISIHSFIRLLNVIHL